jgi:hypothetical protein
MEQTRRVMLYFGYKKEKKRARTVTARTRTIVEDPIVDKYPTEAAAIMTKMIAINGMGFDQRREVRTYFRFE